MVHCFKVKPLIKLHALKHLFVFYNCLQVFQNSLRASAGRDFFFLMTLRVSLIHYVDISRRHSHKCVCTIMVINVQNQQFSASPTHQMSQTSLNEASFAENTALSGCRL